MKVGIWNYGFGNIASVQKAISTLGHDVLICSTTDSLAKVGLLVLPGVGSFGGAMKSMRSIGADMTVRNFYGSGKPIIGICLGAQILFEDSSESIGEPGLSLINGNVTQIGSNPFTIYQGWYSTNIKKDNGDIIKDYFFYSHGYKILPKEGEISATVEHGDEEIVAALLHTNLYCMQFHPEKSGEVGLLYLDSAIKLLIRNSL